LIFVDNPALLHDSVVIEGDEQILDMPDALGIPGGVRATTESRIDDQPPIPTLGVRPTTPDKVGIHVAGIDAREFAGDRVVTDGGVLEESSRVRSLVSDARWGPGNAREGAWLLRKQ
jgi:hypothetical protein